MTRYLRQNEWHVNGSAGIDQDEDVHSTDLVSKKRHLAHWEDVTLYTSHYDDEERIGTDKQDIEAQGNSSYISEEDFYVNKNGQKSDDDIPDSYWDRSPEEITEDEDE